QRNLGLAYVEVAPRSSGPEQATAYVRRAQDLLTGVYEEGLRDGGTVEGLARIHWLQQNPLLARSFAREALAVPDLPVELRLSALQIMADSHLREQQFEEAAGFF